ncbi:uncharacterized protein V1510DRAFT_367634, partial [Dipodascopsis tothii]|uniref:uncharacterized protein n=1 Tax=Dipodascopsis tothii TaxID=44089 RepID=UPI0034D00BCF
SHPLQNRLENWESTQFDLKLENLRRLFGAHEPVRRMMELEACRASMPFIPSTLSRSTVVSANGGLGASSDVANEILMGRDQIVDWEDIYGGNISRPLDFHTELERRMKI